MSTSTIQERIRTARNQCVEISVWDQNPTILSVDMGESVSNYTVVPGTIHCSCQGSQLVPTVCEHMIAVLETEDELANLMCGALAQHKNDLFAAGYREERKEITEIFNELGLRHDAPSTAAEMTQVLQHYSEK